MTAKKLPQPAIVGQHPKKSIIGVLIIGGLIGWWAAHHPAPPQPTAPVEHSAPVSPKAK